VEEVNAFASESDYVTFQRELFTRVNAGELKVLPSTDDGPFSTRRFLEKSTNEIWVLGTPDQAFRGYFKREGYNGALTRTPWSEWDVNRESCEFATLWSAVGADEHQDVGPQRLSRLRRFVPELDGLLTLHDHESC
jgi:hypothetical protein